MPITEIITAIGSFVPIGQTLLEWGIAQGRTSGAKKADIAKAYAAYKAETKLNYAILEHINLDAVKTKDITNPAVVGIVSKLKTETAETLLLALLAEIQNPKKAVKKLPAANISKEDTAEAKKFIRAEGFDTLPFRAAKKVLNPECNTFLEQHTPLLAAGYVDYLCHIGNGKNKRITMFHHPDRSRTKNPSELLRQSAP